MEILVQEANFRALVRRAEQQGRLRGKYRCPVCGMRGNRAYDICCAPVEPVTQEYESDRRSFVIAGEPRYRVVSWREEDS